MNVNFLFRILLFSQLLLTNSCNSPETRPPNVIFIMADDMGYGDLGIYGSQDLMTPNLDQMAREGLRFTQAYAGSPVCAPTRSVLLTGLHSGHTTRRGNRASSKDVSFLERKLVPLRDEDLTVAEMLKDAGYATGAVGKWGLGNPGTTGVPWQQGFDLFFGYLDQVHAHNYYTEYLMRNADTLRIDENLNGQEEVYSHNLMMTETESFIRKNREGPFFLYLPFCLPHGQYEVPDNSMYADKDWPENVTNYAAMITLLDKGVGEIFELLKTLEIDDNTLVFFTSDNGPNPPFIEPLQSNKPFRGIKRQLLEGGIREPMIARWPGVIEEGTVSDLPWAFWDVMPTLADVAGIPAPPGLDGRSIAPTLRGEKQAPPEFMYWEFYDPFQQAVRIGDWKGIRLGTEEPIYLYDLSKDIRETENVAEDNPEIVARIQSVMEREHVDTEYWPMVKKASAKTKTIIELD